MIVDSMDRQNEAQGHDLNGMSHGKGSTTSDKPYICEPLAQAALEQTSQPANATMPTTSEDDCTDNEKVANASRLEQDRISSRDDGTDRSWATSVAVLLDPVSVVCAINHSLSRYLQRLAAGVTRWPKRPRSLFPLPPPGAVLWCRCIAGRSPEGERISASLTKFALLSIAALNS